MDGLAIRMEAISVSRTEEVALNPSGVFENSNKIQTGYTTAQGKQETEGIELAVENFLLPLKEDVQKAMVYETELSPGNQMNSSLNSSRSRQIGVKLLQSLCQFIWDPDMIYAIKAVLRKTYNIMEYHFNIKNDQTDLEDYLEYKPSEIMGFKTIQVFISLVLPDPKLFSDEMSNMKNLMKDNRITQDISADSAFTFLYETFQSFYDFLAGTLDENAILPCFDVLSIPSKCIIQSLSVMFVKQFRQKPKERLERLRQIAKDDESSFEWPLNLADALRLKRRETIVRSKLACDEEMTILARAFSIAPDNLFVKLSVLDTIIGCVRDSSGRFICGPLQLNNEEDSMRFLQDNCAELATKYPKNVMVNSIVSDYFARYVPLRCFDVDFSLRTLMAAYETNPTLAKSTHRFGILCRMSLGKLDESLKWFAETMELDPYHYSATMEYFKTILGRGKEFDVVSLMLEKLETAEADSWNPFERADFYFYLGIACFIIGDTDSTLKWWKEAAKVNETPFTLVDLSDTFMYYITDKNLISIDKLKLWIQSEINALSAKAKAGETYDADKKKFVTRILQLMLGLGQRPFRVQLNKFPATKNFPLVI